METSTLGFTMRPVETELDLRRACQVRALAYGHHMPEWREPLTTPDALDLDVSTLILLCEDKRTGQAIGTLRIQTNRHGPLLIEQAAPLPEPISLATRAEVSRLSTVPGAHPLVRMVMSKAAFLYCFAVQSRYVVIGARNEALVRQYRHMGFTDVYPNKEMVPLPYAGGLPHRVLAIDIYTAPLQWQQRKSIHYDFVFETFHPDIDLGIGGIALCPPVKLASMR